jgi:multidrug efflux pump subunit AcrB
MSVDLFPEVNIPVVVVATFYAGMPPQQIESDITNSYERLLWAVESTTSSLVPCQGLA